MYQVLARKWRPQTFDDLVGQQHVARTLRNALDSDRLAHAYIFAGLRGTGKTTVARILAKCLNCEQGPTTTPCGQCDPCREIAESRAMDVLELDAASRTSVNDVRELQELIAYAPVRDRYKVLIIDEAHMLSKAAFNALLKTLEEPPPRVVFVLATTEIQKLLPTILSRCQVFEFRRVGVREVTDHLRRICDAESVRISDASLERAARAGEGSVRDSLSVLERILAFCGREVEDEDVLRMLGGVRFDVLSRMIGAMAGRDAGTMLQVLDGLVDEGHDLLHFWAELIGALRDLLLLGAVPDRDDLLTRSPEEARALLEAGGALGTEDLIRTFQILADLEPALKSSSQPRFMFESALIRIGSLAAVVPIETLLEAIQGGAPLPPAPSKGPGGGSAPRRPAEGLRQRFEASVLAEKTMLGTILEGARRIDVENDSLVLHFESTMEAMARQLERDENLEFLRTQASRLLGGPTPVEIRVDALQAPAVASATAAPPAPPPEPAAARPPSTTEETSGGPSLIELARSEPGVQKLLREFGAQVVDIQPLDPPPAEADDPPDAENLEESR